MVASFLVSHAILGKTP